MNSSNTYQAVDLQCGRLEDFQGRGTEALQAFDARLASAAAVLQRAGFWEETMARGGSATNLLQLARTASNTPPEVGGRACRTPLHCPGWSQHTQETFYFASTRV